MPDTGDDNDYATAVEKLNGYFSPQTNIAYEVYNFRQTKQKDGELLDSFHTRLRQLDPGIIPRQQPHRRIPFHVREDVEKELERLERLDVIEKVDGPTPKISPIVVVPKKSAEVRICVDMREANKAIKREKHLIPTIDDLTADLNGAMHFSSLDLSSGYHQLELSLESCYVTTFSTHVGLRWYKRLPFGVNAASEMFQETIRELLTGLPGCKNISDDITVFGKSQDEHDKNLRSVLQRLQENSLCLNREVPVLSNRN